MDDQGSRHVADLEQELATLRLRLTHELQQLESTRERLEVFAQVYARTIGDRLEQLRALEPGRTPTRVGVGLADPEPEAAASGRSSAQDELHRLYRQTAQRVHPDLVQDQGERVLRTKVMAEFNAAREASDLDRARQLLEDWEVRPHTLLRDSDTARAAHLVRTIQRARSRLVAVAEGHDRLRQSNLHVLMRIVEAQRRSGVDMLAETAADLDRQLAAARAAVAARAVVAAPLPVEAIAAPPEPDAAAPPVPGHTRLTDVGAASARAAPRPPRRTESSGLLWASGAAVAALLFTGAVGASLLSAERVSVVLLPSTVDRPTSAASAPPAAPTPAPLTYRVIDRTTSASGRSLTTLRIVIDGAASPAEAVSTLAAAARRELRSSQAIVVYAYRSAAEAFGPFTVGRAYLSADGHGWSGDGLTEDGPDDGAIVGSVVTAVGGSIDATAFRVSR